FKSIQALPRLEQRVFELFYWENAMPGEMVDRLAGEEFGSPTLAAVLESLERVQQALTERQRGELLAMTSRGAAAVSLGAPTGDELLRTAPVEPPAHFNPADFVRRGYAARTSAAAPGWAAAMSSWKAWGGALSAAAALILVVAIAMRLNSPSDDGLRGSR